MIGILKINGASLPPASFQAVNKQTANTVAPSIETTPSENKTTESAASSDNKANIKDRFAEKMLERCKLEMEKRPPAERNMENAKILADSLVYTAQEVEKTYGKEAANSFMSQMLSATDQKVDERLLASTVKTFFETVPSPEGMDQYQRKGFSATLNDGCAALMGREDDGSSIDNTEEQDAPEDTPSSGGPGNYGLAYGMNLFFGTVTDTEIKDFDLDYNWVTLSSEPLDLSKANHVTASEFTKSAESTGLADYLLNQIGSEEASEYIKSLPSGSNFMEAVATSVAIVAEEKGQGAAQAYAAYLNQNLKTPIDESLSDVTFHGWRLTGDPDNPPSEPLEPPKDFWFSSSEVKKKGHQGLINKFVDNETGVGIYKTLDLDELYAAYKGQLTANKEIAVKGMNEPVGNLVNTVA